MSNPEVSVASDALGKVWRGAVVEDKEVYYTSHAFAGSVHALAAVA